MCVIGRSFCVQVLIHDSLRRLVRPRLRVLHRSVLERYVAQLAEQMQSLLRFFTDVVRTLTVCSSSGSAYSMSAALTMDDSSWVLDSVSSHDSRWFFTCL